VIAVIDSTFVKELVATATKATREPKALEISGVPYLIMPKPDGGFEISEQVETKEPLGQAIQVGTLTGLVDYVRASLAGLVPPADEKKEPDTYTATRLPGFDSIERAALHVLNPTGVQLIGVRFGYFHQREIFVNASQGGPSFQFGAYCDHEAFIIGLQSLFEQSPERDALLTFLARIMESNVRETSDDGFGQEVTAKAGVALVGNVPVPNPVRLAPYRTFREIEQPESAFILRLQRNPDGPKPKCALFEADGGAWKLEAIADIADFLKRALPGVVVLA
jgi:hypothetical protein